MKVNNIYGFILSCALLASCQPVPEVQYLDAWAHQYSQLKNATKGAHITNRELIANMRERAIPLSLEAEKEIDVNTEIEADSMTLELPSPMQGFLDSLLKVEETAQTLTQKLEIHTMALETIAKRNPTTGAIQNLEHEKESQAYWGDRKGLEDVKQAMLSFIDEMHQYVGKPAQSHFFTDEKVWNQFNEHQPIIGQLVTLEGMKLEVLSGQRAMLNVLNIRLGAPDFRLGKPTVYLVPQSDNVIAGTKFQGRLKMGIETEQYFPVFEGENIEMETGGSSAHIFTLADGSRIPEGKSKGTQTISANVKIPTEWGYDSLFVEKEFTVRKPLMTASTPNVNYFYRKCTNEFWVEMPELETTLPVTVTASRGKVIADKTQPAKFSIIPAGKICLVEVSQTTPSGSLVLGSYKYTVIDPPKPSFQLKENGKIFNGNTQLPTESRMEFFIIPDPNFKAMMPKDSRYGFTTLDIMQLKPDGTIEMVKRVRGGGNAEKGISFDFGEEMRDAFPGTHLLLRVNEVYRRNAQNESIIVDQFTEIERVFNIVLR